MNELLTLNRHTNKMQSTTLNISSQKYDISLQMNTVVLYRDENIVTKGEITRVEQFLLLSQCFLKTAAETSEGVCIIEWDYACNYEMARNT